MKTYELAGNKVTRIANRIKLAPGDRVNVQTPYDSRSMDIVMAHVPTAAFSAVFENGGMTIRIVAPYCTVKCLTRIHVPINDIHKFDNYAEEYKLNVVDAGADLNGMHHLIVMGKFCDMRRAPRIQVRNIVLMTPWQNDALTIEDMV